MHDPPSGKCAPGLAPAVSPAPLVDLVLVSLASSHSRRAYHRALGESFTWYPSNASGEGFTRAVLGRYRSHLGERGLSGASINLHLAALRKLASEAAAQSTHAGATAINSVVNVNARRCQCIGTGAANFCVKSVSLENCER